MFYHQKTSVYKYFNVKIVNNFNNIFHGNLLFALAIKINPF